MVPYNFIYSKFKKLNFGLENLSIHINTSAKHVQNFD